MTAYWNKGMTKEMLTVITQAVVLVYFLLLIRKEFKKPKVQQDEKKSDGHK
ncbi:TMhelix containing protein [Vibrio phage 1.228.O._10N.261.49.C1]|nr:TMhelix containing protein [Vibrio phage 1.157.O._10N.261.45.B7]AUR96627.1 TMhelix containing protein [Vibrio phage 1.228.O._10N.261.49.C1]